MTSPAILTLTMNPAVDVACEAERVGTVSKVRTFNERRDPGGGGINVARVVGELGGDAVAVVLSGGVTGQLLDKLLDRFGVRRHSIVTERGTRVSTTVLDRSTGEEYRFVPEGPVVAEAEWRAALDALARLDGAWVVASGSLPRGVPEDFYARAARIAAGRGQRFVLDTSGEALRAALGTGLALIKPSLNELQRLVGRALPEPAAQEDAAAELVRSGAAGMVALTLGEHGAVLATAEGTRRLPALDVPARGSVGAGDSFLAAMTLSLSRGEPAPTAFGWGVAAGAAAVAAQGTARLTRAEIESLFDRIAEAAAA